MATPVEYGLIAALVAVVGITGLTAAGVIKDEAPPTAKHRVPVCPSGTAYVPITEMCIPGAVNPTRWEWR